MENVVIINGIKVNYLNKINLRTLFTIDYSECPDFVDDENVIYCIHNNINGKVYIGQAKYLYGRFVGYGEFTHISGYRYHCIDEKGVVLYRAIKKYKSRNFIVYELEITNKDLLNERESYWINTLHTCIYDDKCHGYNMTWGGDDCSQLHTPEVRSRAMTNSMKTRFEEGEGDVMYMCHTPEIEAKIYNTLCKNWNGDPCGMLHTEEVYEKRGWSKSINSLFYAINTYLDILHKDHDKINWKIYLSEYSKWTIHNAFFKHLRRVFNSMDKLRCDSRWTKEMEDIFSEGIEDPYIKYYLSEGLINNSKINSIITKLITSIKKYVNELHKNGFSDINFWTYWWESSDYVSDTKLHFYRIKQYAEFLVNDLRLTEEERNLIQEYINTKDKYNIPESWNKVKRR